MRALIPAFALPLAVLGCSPAKEKPAPAITESFADDFERDEIGADYRNTAGGDAYMLANGALMAQGGYNRPLWLRRRLPDRAVIELDVWSQSPAGDIKIELYGDGKSFDADRGGYTSTGYVFIFGGWNNSKSMIAKGDEHGKDLVVRTEPKVEIGRRYHWKIESGDGSFVWYVDDMQTPFLTLKDSQPLTGEGHGFLGFGNWESNVGFDNLQIRAR